MFQEKPIPVPISKKINVVLDIDETLANGFELSRYRHKEKGFANLIEDNPYLKPLIDRGLGIYAAGVPHIIQPGAIEFIRYLLDTPQIKLSFFSNGSKERNIEFVDKLMHLVIGDEKKYANIRSNIKVFSREDTIDSRQYQQPGLKGCFGGQRKKDLDKVIAGSDDDIEYTILIDDDASYMAPGQEKNILKVEGCGYSRYSDIFKRETSDEKFIEYEFKTRHYPRDFSKINNIFYAAGILKYTLDMIDNENTAPSTTLFNLQFRPDEDFPYEYKYSLLGEIKYYETGLEMLRKYNPRLNFCLPSNYKIEKLSLKNENSFFADLAITGSKRKREDVTDKNEPEFKKIKTEKSSTSTQLKFAN